MHTRRLCQCTSVYIGPYEHGVSCDRTRAEETCHRSVSDFCKLESGAQALACEHHPERAARSRKRSQGKSRTHRKLGGTPHRCRFDETRAAPKPGRALGRSTIPIRFGPYLSRIPEHQPGHCTRARVAMSSSTLERGNRAPSSYMMLGERTLGRAVRAHARAARIFFESETQPKIPPCALIMRRPISWNSGK